MTTKKQPSAIDCTGLKFFLVASEHKDFDAFLENPYEIIGYWYEYAFPRVFLEQSPCEKVEKDGHTYFAVDAFCLRTMRMTLLEYARMISPPPLHNPMFAEDFYMAASMCEDIIKEEGKCIYFEFWSAK